MKRKKLLALFMAALMLLAAAGCGKKDVDSDPPVRIEPDIDLIEYVYHDKQAPESCGYLYVPKCEDPDVLNYVNSPEGRAAILKDANTVDTKAITYSDPFTVILLDEPEVGGEMRVAVQLYCNGKPTKISSFTKSADGKFEHRGDFAWAFETVACFVQSSEDKPVIFAIGDGSCAIFDNKIYGLYYFEHEPLTENDVTRLKAFDYDEVIKINVKQW